MLKRVACILGGVALAAGLLAGCAAPTQTAAPGDAVEISVFNYMIGDLPEKSPVLDYLSAKLNIKIKSLAANSNNWSEKLNLLMASGDTPDIFMSYGADLNNRQYYKWIQEGLIAPISDHYGKYPNIKAQVDKFDYLKNYQDGKHYFLPIKSYEGEYKAVNDDARWIRKDWLDKAGLPVPETKEAYIKTMYAFAGKDMDGNGVAGDSFAITSQYKVYGLPYDLYDASYNRYEKAGGKIGAMIVADSMKTAIKGFRDMYVKGVLDPSFLTNSSASYEDKFISGKVGTYSFKGIWYDTLYKKFMKVYPDRDPEELCAFVPPLRRADGSNYTIGGENFWLHSSVSGTLDGDKMARVFGFLEYLLSDEGMKLMRYGVKDVHYSEEGGQMKSLLPKDDNGIVKKLHEVDAMANLNNLVRWDNSFIPGDGFQKEKREDYFNQYMSSAVPVPIRGLYIGPDKIQPSLRKDLETFAVERFAAMIINDVDIDREWESYKQEWYDMGGSKLMEAVNEAAKNQGMID